MVIIIFLFVLENASSQQRILELIIILFLIVAAARPGLVTTTAVHFSVPKKSDLSRSGHFPKHFLHHPQLCHYHHIFKKTIVLITLDEAVILGNHFLHHQKQLCNHQNHHFQNIFFIIKLTYLKIYSCNLRRGGHFPIFPILFTIIISFALMKIIISKISFSPSSSS